MIQVLNIDALVNAGTRTCEEEYPILADCHTAIKREVTDDEFLEKETVATSPKALSPPDEIFPRPSRNVSCHPRLVTGKVAIIWVSQVSPELELMKNRILSKLMLT
jgi:hypothetical protein